MSEPILAGKAVAALLDELAIAHLDFHPTCEARIRVSYLLNLGPLELSIPLGFQKPCEAEAVGVVTCRWCGSATTVCEAHRALAIDGGSIQCLACGTLGRASLVFHFTPWGA